MFMFDGVWNSLIRYFIRLRKTPKTRNERSVNTALAFFFHCTGVPQDLGMRTFYGRLWISLFYEFSEMSPLPYRLLD
jgi:hypothetical protein